MKADFDVIKQTVEKVHLAERECVEIIYSLLSRENEVLHNTVIDKIVCILKKWNNTPPVELLKELKRIDGEG